MGVYQTELEFVGCFWREAIGKTPRALQCMNYLPPEAIDSDVLRQAYRLIAARLIRDAALSPTEAVVFVGLERALKEATDSEAVPVVLRALAEFATAEHPNGDIAGYARVLLTEYRARVAYEQFDDVGRELYEMARGWEDETKPRPSAGAVLRRLTEGIMEVHSFLMRRPGESRLATGREDIMAALLEETEATGGRGYRWPWPKLERMLGTNIQPGGVYGFTGRPGGGKSLLASNMWRTISTYAPVLPAITEMPGQWIKRGIAAEAAVEQTIAELGRWDESDLTTIRALREIWQCDAERARMELHDRKQRYRGALKALRERTNWDFVGGRVSLEELFVGWRMLRSQFPGRHVIGIIDHAHNLNEPDIDLRMPQMMARIKEFCESDPDGFSAIVFFQPRKLAREDSRDKKAKCRPVYASEISGNAEAILDTHASVFRQWVEVDHDSPPLMWGQQPCKRTLGGMPVLVPEKQSDSWDWPFARLDNEHLYMEADKTRILPHFDGPQVQRIILNCWGPYGTVFEASSRSAAEAAA